MINRFDEFEGKSFEIVKKYNKIWKERFEFLKPMKLDYDDSIPDEIEWVYSKKDNDKEYILCITLSNFWKINFEMEDIDLENAHYTDQFINSNFLSYEDLIEKLKLISKLL
jgi:hypothetical protein